MRKYLTGFIDIGETKFRKKMYKSGKFWVAAGMTALTVGAVGAQRAGLPVFTEGLQEASAETVTSPLTIDQVTDADTQAGASRTVNWNGSNAWNNSDVTGLGTYNGSTWTADRTYGGQSKDPAGATYVKLVANGASTAGYLYLTRQFDATKTFTITGYLHPNVKDADTWMTRDYSDWTGLLLTPTDPNKIASSYDFAAKGGGGLGIEGMKNAFALGVDFHKNSDKNDPAEGPFAALRTTNSSGTLTATQGLQNNVAGTATYTDGYNLTNWNTTIKYTLTWNPTGGPNGGPSIKATMTPTGTRNSEKTSWTVDTAAGKVTLPSVSALTFGLNAINGQNKNDQFASIDSVSGTMATGTTTVNYVDTSGKVIKTATSFIGSVGETVGITGLSSDASTADYTFGAPTIRGYKVSSATNSVKISQTASANVITIKYTALPFQESIIQTDTPALWSDSAVIASYWSTDQDNPLGSDTSVAASIMDASLVRSGYSYYVTDQKGGSYATMSSAAAATSVNAWDSTSNSAGVQSDAAPQSWTVKYVPDYQGAYLYTRDYSYVNGSYSATTSSGTYKDAVGGKTGGAINFGTTDSSLPKSGYTYTVTGPDNITYSNLSSAVAANSFDSTDNKIGSAQASSDASYQYFTVNYTPATQTTSLVVDSNSPVKAG